MTSYLKVSLALVATFAVWGVSQRAFAPVFAQGQGAPAIKRETARPLASVEGKESYAAYCAVCHGRDGAGNGPAASALKVAPTDLTRLAARNNGKFDARKVEQLILGKSKVPPSHGAPDMPIWGPVFHSMSPDRAAEALRIQNLVGYLESIQAK